jgi:hypothetical protein
MRNISEEHLDFKSLEVKIFEIMCLVACELMRQYLEWRDLGVMALRDKKEYRLISIRVTTIKTVMGEVTYGRRYYKKSKGGYVFLLDEAMGIDADYGLVSENLAEQIVHECADKSFRKAAVNINRTTGQSLSAMGAWNVVQAYGGTIAAQEIRLVELSDSGCGGHLGNVNSRVLFEEYDDVHISRQREQRRKSGDAARGVGKIGRKLGKLPMHVGVAYTGWTDSGGGRHSTANKIAYASFGRLSIFRGKFGALLDHRFDMDVVEQRLTNGDGESWIRTTAEENDSILQLDPFHRSKAIMRAVGDKSDRALLFDAIGEKDVGKVLASICEMALDAEDESEEKKLTGLYGYFYSNRDSFLTWQERGVELPKPPDGISYRGMGVQESNNCLITQRMKRRRASWSEDGGNNMARILCFRSTIGLDAILGDLPEPEVVEETPEPLSAAQTPTHDGTGYGADWLYAPMPFEQVFRTSGREAIRNMLRLKPLSQLPFLSGS